MIYLKDNFTRGNREFQKLHSDDRITVFQVVMVYPTGAKDTFLEVFKPRFCQPNKFVDDEYERYPSDEEWGARAWTITTMGSLRKILTGEFGISQDEINTIAEKCQNCLPVVG